MSGKMGVAARRGSVLVFALVLTAIAATVVGSVGAYYVHNARIARVYQEQTAERFAGEYAVESVMSDIAGIVVDPLTSEGEKIASKATSFDELKKQLQGNEEQTVEVGGYVVDTKFDIADLDKKVDVDGDGIIDDDSRLLTVEAVVSTKTAHGGLEAKRIRQVLQIDQITIGKDVQTTMPVFDYVYFANNYGRLESKGIIANGNVGSNDRLTLDGATVNGYVWAHGSVKDEPSAVTLNNSEGQPPKIWPYVTYMKRVTNAYKVDEHDFYTQVRPTDPNHGVTNGTKVAIEWTGGYAYPGGSDDYGTIGDDGIYIPSANPYTETEPQWTGGDCPTALDPDTYPADYTATQPTAPAGWTGGDRPGLSPATRPEDWSVSHPYPTVSDPPSPVVADPGDNPLTDFWTAMPVMNSANPSRSNYYEWEGFLFLGSYVFQYNSYKTDIQAWAKYTSSAGNIGQSWSPAIPDIMGDAYYNLTKKKKTKNGDTFKNESVYESDLNTWVANAKANPGQSTIYAAWKKKYDEYEAYKKKYDAWDEERRNIVAQQETWKTNDANRKKEQAQWDKDKAAQDAWDQKYKAWKAQYDVDYAQYLVDYAAWKAAKEKREQEQADWRTANAARNAEISDWNSRYAEYESEHDKWQSQYDYFNDKQREQEANVNNGYYKLDLTKDLLTQHEYLNDEGTGKERKHIVSVTTNLVEMPNVSDDDMYRNYCRTNEVIMTNVFGVAVKQKGGSLVCRNRYQEITSKSTTEKDITWSYTYHDKKLTVGDRSLTKVFVTNDLTASLTLTRTLTSVNFSGGYWGDSYNYPFRDKACPNAEKGSVILIGTAKYPITINGPVYFDNDVLIRGFVSGQGSIYAGRNIHIIGDITYLNPPSWPHSNTDLDVNSPHVVANNNRNRDLLLLLARGNIVVGDYTSNTWMTCFQKWVNNAGSDGGDSSAQICNQINDQEIGYPSDLTGFNRNYLRKEDGGNGWDGGKKVTFGMDSQRYDYDTGIGPSYWYTYKGTIYHVRFDYYHQKLMETTGIRHYETKLGDLVLKSLMQSGSTSSSANYPSSLWQKLVWSITGRSTTTVNTGETSLSYAQTSSAISSNKEAGDITHIDASLFANHGIFGLVGGSVNKKFTLNGGIVCRDEGLLPTMTDRFSGAEVWLNYDLRLRSDSAEGNTVVAPSLSTRSAARTELRVSVKSWQQL